MKEDNNLTEVEYCDCEKPTLGVNVWTCGCGKSHATFQLTKKKSENNQPPIKLKR